MTNKCTTAVVTGASSEVGQLIINHFDYNWIFIDRTHGVTLPDDIQIFKNAIIDAHIFFNLANLGTLQTDLLAHTWNAWNNLRPDCPRKIINFGSLITEIDMQTILQMNNWSCFSRNRAKSNYLAEKLLLNKTHVEYKNLHLRGLHCDYCLPQSILIKFGNVLRKENRLHEPFTTGEELIEVVSYAINSKSYISDLEVRWN